MANLPFNIEKAIQAVAHVLRSNSGRMDYIRALKLLYIAERRELKEAGHELVGNKLVAMKNGPLHSCLYDFCKGVGQPSDQRRWNEFFETKGYHLVAKVDPGVGKLSEYEIELISDVVDQHAEIDTWSLVELTHDFPEWLKSYPDPSENTSRPIELSDLIDDPAQLAAIEEELEEESRMAEILR